MVEYMENKVLKPKIRFKGFTDTWEQRKLDDIVDRYDNLRIPVAANLRIKGNTPYYGAKVAARLHQPLRVSTKNFCR
mgnify:CR=1 FL=1